GRGGRRRVPRLGAVRPRQGPAHALARHVARRGARRETRARLRPALRQRRGAVDERGLHRGRIPRPAIEDGKPMTASHTFLSSTAAALSLAALSLAPIASEAQRGPAPPSARESAPIDLTGYSVSVGPEDWRHRMATPRKGDYESVPLNAAGRRAADAWDLEQDNAAGLECKAFGVGGIMRQPGRLHVTWEDDDTLRIDFDAGSQTRLLHF